MGLPVAVTGRLGPPGTTATRNHRIGRAGPNKTGFRTQGVVCESHARPLSRRPTEHEHSSVQVPTTVCGAVKETTTTDTRAQL